jgi:putative DNA primase/helicase
VERRLKNPLLQRADEYLSALGEFAKKSESRDRRRAIVDLAAVESEVSIRAEQLDASPWLINLQNGTVDLRSGSLDPHQRDQLLTRVIPIQFDPEADVPALASSSSARSSSATRS